jgi:hypothetical protein
MRGKASAINNSDERPALPTSRAAPHGERAVLAILRAASGARSA